MLLLRFIRRLLLQVLHVRSVILHILSIRGNMAFRLRCQLLMPMPFAGSGFLPLLLFDSVRFFGAALLVFF